MKNLELVTLVRSIIKNKKQTKHSPIYTNKYANCRTVKINFSDKKGKLAAKIMEALDATNSIDHSVKVLTRDTRWGFVDHSFIVRLPYTAEDAVV